ncbi:ArsR/SmtB family transcription factor [Deinococcus yunweiensis]|uniref:ArsR/SmtB family transcription factor n=1 Tax=Deinococcus yunweiensis TaxID=367282 RepID=UPI00398E5916
MPVSGTRLLNLEGETALPILKALASETRLLILSLLTHNAMNVSELAAALGLPHSTVNFNLGQLQAAGLITVEYEPGTRGSQKLCSRRFDEVAFKLPGAAVEANVAQVTVSMPIGNYSHIEATPTCGLASEVKIIGLLDDPRSFYEPEHVYAQILWLGKAGYVEYMFPNNLPYGSRVTRLELSMEVCSEAPQYNHDWPSDITVWINDHEIGTFTSPGDFGGERGRLTPEWWVQDQTMSGQLKRWTVTEAGSGVDGSDPTGVALSMLQLNPSTRSHIKVRIGVKPDAVNRRGLNLFGRKFGNYEQDLVMRMDYAFPRPEDSTELK